MMPESENTLFCAGFGYTASTFAQTLQQKGWAIVGTTRNPDKAARMKADGVTPLLLDHEAGGVGRDVAAATALVISTPPDADGCPAHRMLAPFLQTTSKVRWIGYLSSNGVYGDHDGNWVDETTVPEPTSARGQRRLMAEQQWLQTGEHYNLPIKIFRLPGIYGPGRSALDNVREGRARRILKPGQVFNRMHVDDIALALKQSLHAETKETLFNLCDDLPSPPQDVITFACDLLDVPPPEPVALDDAGLSEMGRSFYRDNKRVRNTRMKDLLEVKLQYPSYKEGLRAILQHERR